jgi:integrase
MEAIPAEAIPTESSVLEFDYGVKAYPPRQPGGYWRLRWKENHRQRDTTAKDRATAIARAVEIVEGLASGNPSELIKATGADLVAHYLDPRRRPPRVEQWSPKMREEQQRYCDKYVLPIIATVRCRELGRGDFQRILDQVNAPATARQVRRTLTAIINAGLIEGYLLPRQDVMRAVRWLPANPDDLKANPVSRAITEDEIPTSRAIHNLAERCAQHSRVWWRELEILLAAYSGMRWGEHAALTADRVDPVRRRISVDRQVVELRSELIETLPKGRRRRVTMYPASTPGGIDLAEMVQRRLDELDDDELMFPAPTGGWERRSNYGRNLWDKAAEDVGWPRRLDRHGWLWTFHSLRHVFATWALAQPNIRIEDVSRLMGHSSIRVTQEIYVHVSSDVYDRFFDATLGDPR